MGRDVSEGQGMGSSLGVTRSLRLEPRVWDLEQPRGTSFEDGFPWAKKDEQKLKGAFHLY